MSDALRLTGVVRRFGPTPAVDGLDLVVGSGVLHGLVGPNGAGKTTTLRLLAGLMAPDAGEIEVSGLDPVRSARAIRERIGLVPQDQCLYGDLSVAENLWFFGRLFGLDRQTFAERKKRLLEITNLERFTGRRADALSGGMYRKLALACALLHRPPILLLDEPTNGVDPISRREIWNLLYELVDDDQVTALVTTPYMDEAERCHRVTLISSGRVVAEGTPEALTAEARADSFEEAFIALTARTEVTA